MAGRLWLDGATSELSHFLATKHLTMLPLHKALWWSQGTKAEICCTLLAPHSPPTLWLEAVTLAFPRIQFLWEWQGSRVVYYGGVLVYECDNWSGLAAAA